MPTLAFHNTRVELPLGTVCGIGRDRQCEVHVVDPHVSRRHAEIYVYEDGAALISDMESVNGLLLSDERVPFALLLPGQEFQLGTVCFRYE
jgi:pSer/pThr/pTyr-binding forkhead associated (FHA) protein